MAILILLSDWDVTPWVRRLQNIMPEQDVRTSLSDGPVEDIDYALVWKSPPGQLKQLPNLKIVFSLGAGVDHVFADPDLPDVPVVRMIDNDLTMRMSEYVVLHVLMHHRKQRAYDRLQQNKEWREYSQAAANEVRVGILGLGTLGQDAARKLQILGFKVSGWSRSPKNIDGITCFSGPDGLNDFLGATDILVCLLPLTAQTKGILNGDLFRRLAHTGPLEAPVLINAGRGGLQVEADILECLESGELGAATLDVFETEPLPKTSPLWNHPRVTVTPHNASVSDPDAICRNILEQITAYESGAPLKNVVDPKQGY
ncbi:MAG: glyoxylate/hydroxypyruvate reductase A [Fimbriimonadaceae bacterium]|nr:glyoxylate/hydroxypyruvate reductase A [Alphaproteobacteria bacterium]